jgi:hypothetical protein
MDYSNHYLEKIKKNIISVANDINHTPYESYHDYEISKWKQLEGYYLRLGVNKNENELKNIITELCVKFV